MDWLFSSSKIIQIWGYPIKCTISYVFLHIFTVWPSQPCPNLCCWRGNREIAAFRDVLVKKIARKVAALDRLRGFAIWTAWLKQRPTFLFGWTWWINKWNSHVNPCIRKFPIGTPSKFSSHVLHKFGAFCKFCSEVFAHQHVSSRCLPLWVPGVVLQGTRRSSDDLWHLRAGEHAEPRLSESGCECMINYGKWAANIRHTHRIIYLDITRCLSIRRQPDCEHTINGWMCLTNKPLRNRASRRLGSTAKAEETKWQDFPVWCRRQRRCLDGQHGWEILERNGGLNGNLIYGYESIPINTIFRGMNIHLPAILMFTRGTRFWPTAI